MDLRSTSWDSFVNCHLLASTPGNGASVNQSVPFNLSSTKDLLSKTWRRANIHIPVPTLNNDMVLGGVSSAVTPNMCFTTPLHGSFHVEEVPL